MSEELVKQLSSYRAQLQQVEAALSTDPENEDLLKLQKDLQVRPITVSVPVAQIKSNITVTIIQMSNYLRLVMIRVPFNLGTGICSI